MTRLRALGEERSGNVAVMFALASPLLVGAAGLGVETSYWYMEKTRVQAAVDASAYTAALELRATGSEDAAEANGLVQASMNGIKVGTDGVDVAASKATGKVTVTASRSLERNFSKFLDKAPLSVSARASAIFEVKSKACVLALSATASRAAEVGGNADLKLVGCSMMANSTAADAVYVGGSAKLSAPCLISAGGADVDDGATLTSCSTTITQAPVAADPFKDLPSPSDSGTCQSTNGNKLQPGRYCGGLGIHGKIKLDPGVYVISGDLKINAKAVVEGTGVTIYVTNGGRVTINGGAELNLSAPTSGSYAGVLFFGDRDSTAGQRNVFNGNATSKLSGAIYFPSQAVDYQGNFSGANGCVQVVADTVGWKGSTSMSVDCSQFGMRDIPVYTVVRIDS
jgi:Flp pilus assembly protein TadG